MSFVGWVSEEGSRSLVLLATRFHTDQQGWPGSCLSPLSTERRDGGSVLSSAGVRFETGDGAEALEAQRGTGVRSRSAGGRVTSPAWAQMALHMAHPFPEPCPLRQHLRSQQGLAETF